MTDERIPVTMTFEAWDDVMVGFGYDRDEDELWSVINDMLLAREREGGDEVTIDLTEDQIKLIEYAL